MRVVSLFSGCGGMDIGVERAGGEVIFSSDIMPETWQTFQANFPDKEFLLDDIRNVEAFPSADVVVGGYPCQSFSMGGNRAPADDPRTFLYKEFARAVKHIEPKFFVAENVSGMKSLEQGRWLEQALNIYKDLGRFGYNLSWSVLHAEQYGIPQKRKRLVIVGVRKDLGHFYHFPAPTHCKPQQVKKLKLLPYASHGEVIKHLPLWPKGEFYERPHDPEGHFSWYYMSRNRKAEWFGPAFTVVANFRHITLHPGSPTMRLLWSNLADGWKQKWEFTDQYEHLEIDPSLPKLEEPRRLSWREAALIQTFPANFEPAGKLEKKFEQIGNAVPPKLMEAIFRPLMDGTGLRTEPFDDGTVPVPQTQMVQPF